MNGHSYKGYTINRACGKDGLWYAGKGGRNLFYGIESLDAAKTIVDSMVFLSTVKW